MGGRGKKGGDEEEGSRVSRRERGESGLVGEGGEGRKVSRLETGGWVGR